MAYTIATDPRGFVILTPMDPASVAEARIAAEEVAAQTSSLPVLVDVRQTSLVPSRAEAESLVSVFGATGPLAGRPVAIVATPGVKFGVARVLLALSELRGATNLSVFSSFEAAIKWAQETPAAEG